MLRCGFARPEVGSQTLEEMSVTNKPTTAEIVILAGGAVALVFSFFHFYGFGDAGVSAWGSGLFPVATLMVIFAVISAVVVALKIFGVSLPANVLGFTWPQIHLELGFFAALYAVAYLLVSTGGTDKKIGFWGILIGCLASLVGGILLRNEGSSTTGPTA
jgi:hypothetical protein